MGQGTLQHDGLFRDFFGHEVFEASFIDARIVDLDRFDSTVSDVALRIADLKAGAGDDGPITFFKVRDPVCHWCQRNCIRANKHFAISVTNRKRRTFAGCDQQIVFTVKQKTQRISTFEAGNGFLCCITRAETLGNIVVRQQCDGFGVGVRLVANTLFT